MTTSTTTTLPESFLRLPQVLSAYPVSRSAWWAGIRAGRYPQPVKLSERTTAWRASDIAALIEATSKAANDGEASK